MATAVLSARDDAGAGLRIVSLEIDVALGRLYTTPGQYVEVKTGSGDGYFVLASDPLERPWQLLVRNAGGAADALATLPIGSAIDVRGPLGNGFSVERMRSRQVAVAVVGSALGVARPVLRRRIADGVASATHLFLGLRSPQDLPLADEVDAWAARGVDVALCLSRAELHEHPEVLPRARRAVGYVQHAISRALDSGEVPHGTLVVAAGPDELLADMRTLASAAPGGGAKAIHAGPSIEVLTNV